MKRSDSLNNQAIRITKKSSDDLLAIKRHLIDNDLDLNLDLHNKNGPTLDLVKFVKLISNNPIFRKGTFSEILDFYI